MKKIIDLTIPFALSTLIAYVLGVFLTKSNNQQMLQIILSANFATLIFRIEEWEKARSINLFPKKKKNRSA